MTSFGFLKFVTFLEVFEFAHALMQIIEMWTQWDDEVLTTADTSLWAFQIGCLIFSMVALIIMLCAYFIYSKLHAENQGERAATSLALQNRDHSKYQRLFILQTIHIGMSILRLFVFFWLAALYIRDLIVNWDKFESSATGLSKFGFMSGINTSQYFCRRTELEVLYDEV